jgi:hypothetical protein
METATLAPASDFRATEAIPHYGNSNSASAVEPEAVVCGFEAGPPALPARFTSGSYYSYSSETFSLKYRTQDGDTLELTSKRESFQMAEWNRLPSEADDAQAAEGAEAKDAKDWDGLRELMQQAKTEMRQQQLNILKAMLGERGESTENLQGLWAKLAADYMGGDPQGTQEGQNALALLAGGDTDWVGSTSLRLTLEEYRLHVEIGESGEAEADPAGLKEYWNAENTSDRIVDFAMLFAGLGGDNESFGEKIRNAIEEGFSQAVAMTGPLPGDAGKLTEETHKLTFEKLELKLAELRATPYNQDLIA